MHLIKHSNMLKCTLEPADQLSDAQFLEMSANTQGLFLPCQKAQLNGALTLMFDTKAYNTLESSASHLTALQFRQILRELLRMIRAVSQQSQLSSLRLGNLRVEFDKIYVHSDTLRPALIYTPVSQERTFPEDEFRAEIAETISSNENLHDDGNNEILRYLKGTENDLFGLIDLIPALHARTAPVAAAAPPVTAQSEALQRLADENKRMKNQIKLLIAAIVGVFVLVLILLLVLGGGDKDDVAAQPTTADSAGTQETMRSAAEILMLGDLDGDGAITTKDTTLLRKAINGDVTLTKAQASAADLDGNDAITMDDLTLLMLKMSETKATTTGGDSQ